MPRQTTDKGKPKKKPSGIVLFARDAGVALAVVAAILLGMFAYTGLWPPLVVIESNSMMHGSDNMSHIGAIDTGDLVLVKKIGDASDVKTYVDGYSSGYKTYGDFGDVVIYRRAGDDSTTPIIHRALIYLEANPDGLSYRAPSLQHLPAGKYSAGDSDWNNLTDTLTIFGVGYLGVTVSIDIPDLVRGGQAKSGFITKGDHNQQIDIPYWGPQLGYRPIDVSWIVGKARGEIPWFGLLKLWSTDTLNSPSPPNSIRNLWISLALIVLSPILVDVSLALYEKRRLKRMKEEAANREEKAKAEDPSGRAVEPPQT